MAKYSHAGSFNFRNPGTKLLLIVPAGVNGTISISNNSSKKFDLLLNGTVAVKVNPYSVGTIDSISGGSPTKVAIKTKGPTNGSYLFQQFN